MMARMSLRAWVLHVDLDQFIAAVEVLRRPELAGLPVVVGGRGDPTERGVVSTASYEARAFGVGSGMPLRTAARKCPDAVFLPVDHAGLRRGVGQVMDTLRVASTCRVEVLGWDEAFLARRDRRPARPSPQDGAGRGAASDRGCTARWASATTSCRPRSPPTSASRAGVCRLTTRRPGSSVMGDRPTDALWGIGRKTAAQARRARHPHRRRARRHRDAGAGRRGSARRWGRGTAGSAAASTPRRSTRRRTSPAGHGRETTFQENQTDWAGVADAVRELAAQVADDIAAEGRPAVRVGHEAALRAVRDPAPAR